LTLLYFVLSPIPATWPEKRHSQVWSERVSKERAPSQQIKHACTNSRRKSNGFLQIFDCVGSIFVLPLQWRCCSCYPLLKIGILDAPDSWGDFIASPTNLIPTSFGARARESLCHLGLSLLAVPVRYFLDCHNSTYASFFFFTFFLLLFFSFLSLFFSSSFLYTGGFGVCLDRVVNRGGLPRGPQD